MLAGAAGGEAAGVGPEEFGRVVQETAGDRPERDAVLREYVLPRSRRAAGY